MNDLSPHVSDEIRRLADEAGAKPYNTDEAPARDPLLVERERSHGSFKSNAEIWHKLVCAIPHDHNLTPSQYLALNMIFLKIARAMQNPQVKDHFNDIAGYAKLAGEDCE